MNKAKLFFFLMVLIQNVSFGQIEEERTVLTRQEMADKYQENIKKSRIDGVYIPVDDAEAIKEIRELSPAEGLASFAAIKDEWEASRKLYFGLGRWMSVNWSFYEGSRLSHSLKQKGLLHPDDMVTYLLIMLHRDLNKNTVPMDDILGQLILKRKEIAKSSIDTILSVEIKRK
jgi:hypothetical protein